MNQPPAVDPGVLRVVGAFLRYVDQQPATDPLRRALTTRHINALARLAVRTLNPPGRDVEATHRRPAGPVVEVSLNETERLVLELLPSELETDGIGEVLGLTKGQVQRAQKSLHRMLGSQSRHRTVAVAVELGVLRLEAGVWRVVRPSVGLSGVAAAGGALVASAGFVGASEAVAS